MSQINTNGIDVNYPVPGQNNSSQGFRDNFSQIKNNINTAATEITDLQNKAVLKAALNNSVLNNDMANVLISNASTSGFRATTYNLGNALAGTVLVDVNRADVQYGTVSGNVTFQFGGWAPTNTASNVALRLTVANANAVISLPSQCISSNNNYGVTLLENYVDVTGTATLTPPANTEILEYSFSTLDCGNTITVAPLNRPFQATQVITREISPTGQPGDLNGAIAVSPSVNQLSISSSNTGMSLSTVVIANTAGGFTCSATPMPLAVGQELTISGTAGGSGSISGYSDPSTYYIIDTNGSTTFQLSTTSDGPNITTTAGTPTGLTYEVNNGYLNTSNTSQLYTDLPVVFTGVSMESNVNIGTTYYVRNVVSNTRFTISSTIGGGNVNLEGNSSPTDAMYANPVSYLYVCTADYNSTPDSKEATNTYASTNAITLTGTANLEVNMPIIFSGNVFGGIESNVVYYIKEIDSPNITVSQTRVNGVAGSELVVSNANGNCIVSFSYGGNDIWKRIPLSPW